MPSRNIQMQRNYERTSEVWLSAPVGKEPDRQALRERELSFPTDTRTTIEGHNVIEVVPYDATRHRRGVREVLAKNGWEDHYIAGPLAGLDALSSDSLPGTRSKVCVCVVDEHFSGFVCVEYREWNRLGTCKGSRWIRPSSGGG